MIYSQTEVDEENVDQVTNIWSYALSILLKVAEEFWSTDCYFNNICWVVLLEPCCPLLVASLHI